MNNLKSELEGQLHLLDYWDELDMEQQSTLVRQIGMFDVPVLNSALKKSLIPKPPNANEISRIDSDRIIDKQLLSSEELNRLETLGGWRSKQLVWMWLIHFFCLGYDLHVLLFCLFLVRIA